LTGSILTLCTAVTIAGYPIATTDITSFVLILGKVNAIQVLAATQYYAPSYCNTTHRSAGNARNARVISANTYFGTALCVSNQRADERTKTKRDSHGGTQATFHNTTKLVPYPFQHVIYSDLSV
jgi:hypothetical protein